MNTTRHAGVEIPNDWWPSFAIPGPLVGIGEQEPPAKANELAKRRKSIVKRLNAQQRQLLKIKVRLNNARPSPRVQVSMIGTKEQAHFTEVPLDKLEFGVQQTLFPGEPSGHVPKSFTGGWLKTGSQKAFAKASVEHSKCLTRIIELEEELKALDEAAKQGD